MSEISSPTCTLNDTPRPSAPVNSTMELCAKVRYLIDCNRASVAPPCSRSPFCKPGMVGLRGPNLRYEDGDIVRVSTSRTVASTDKCQHRQFVHPQVRTSTHPSSMQAPGGLHRRHLPHPRCKAGQFEVVASAFHLVWRPVAHVSIRSLSPFTFHDKEWFQHLRPIALPHDPPCPQTENKEGDQSDTRQERTWPDRLSPSASSRAGCERHRPRPGRS